MSKRPTQIEKAIKNIDDEIAALDEHAKRKLIEQQAKQTTKKMAEAAPDPR
jgi:hypothetical protein